jgi:hypothetical protein
MRKKYYYFLAGFASGILVLIFLGYSLIKKEAVTGTSSDFPQGYRIISPQIADNLEFAGEKVPLENFEVRERIDRELLVNTYWHSATMLGIKRAARWFPLIEQILEKQGIPEDFKYLSLIESGLTNAVSPAGATGFWQIMEGSALKYGLEVNSEIDERYNVVKSTEAACKFLRDAYNNCGSWTLAAASYNMGVSGVEKQINKQRSSNYYNLVLSEETSRYIARIVAVKEIMRNPAEFGFEVREEDLYKPLRTFEIQINSSINNLADFAEERGINYKILKFYNPWLRDNTISNKQNKLYTLYLPEEGSIYIIDDKH